jgi:Asp-tRNA(Asn)/Glu-tRNA(Gln) amidotransferase C subunit
MLLTRLKSEMHESSEGKPIVVFYTAQNSDSSKVEEKVFTSAKGKDACIISQFATLKKVDVSGVERSSDPVINESAAPMLAFYKSDGQYYTHLGSKRINEREYCQTVSKLLRAEKTSNTGAEVRNFTESLKRIETIVKQLTKADVKIEQGRFELISKKRGNSKTSMTKKINKLESDTNVLRKEFVALKAQLY